MTRYVVHVPALRVNQADVRMTPWVPQLGDDRQFVQIFIDDCRPTAANPQTSCGVHLTEVGREGCSENQWHVGTGELLQQLQRSSGAIEGTGESCCGSCGCPAPHAAATALPPG